MRMPTHSGHARPERGAEASEGDADMSRADDQHATVREGADRSEVLPDMSVLVVAVSGKPLEQREQAGQDVFADTLVEGSGSGRKNGVPLQDTGDR